MSEPSDCITSVDAAVALVGARLGPTPWQTITQPAIDDFGRVTGDMQWIHVDPVRASSGPFGRCVAHGLLTLSLAGGQFFHQLIRTTARNGVNYGSDRVRYPAALLVDSRIRAYADILAAGRLEGQGEAVQMTVRITVEIDGVPKPACVADFVVRYSFQNLAEGTRGNP